MTNVMSLDAFRQQTFATALAAARKGRATALGTHPGAETVLTFARSLGWLVSAFHKTPEWLRPDWRAVTLGVSMALSTQSLKKCSFSCSLSSSYLVYYDRVRGQRERDAVCIGLVARLNLQDCQAGRILE
jgi:hypothetical protein